MDIRLKWAMTMGAKACHASRERDANLFETDSEMYRAWNEGYSWKLAQRETRMNNQSQTN